MRRMVTGSLVLSVGLTSVVLVAPVLSNPLAASPHPVEARSSVLRLGNLDAPADGVTFKAGLLRGATLAPDTAAIARSALARPAKTITVTRESTSEFSAVGVTWARDVAVTGVSVAVRAKDAAGKWGQWNSADAEEDPSGKTGNGVRGGAGMIWTGPSKGVEVAVTAVTGKAPRDVRVELIDPGKSAADANPDAAAPSARAEAGLLMPKIYSRVAWGAVEKKMTWTPTYAPTVKAITLHHTVNSNNYTSSQVPAMLRSIYQFHAVSNGWGDIGYNVVVDRFGRLWEGRAGGLTRAAVGAHAGGFNYQTAGISMLGNYSTATVPTAMREAIARFVAWKLSLYGVDPTGTTSLTGGNSSKYKDIVTLTLPTVFPHRSTSLTACPGTGGMNALPWIRSRAKALMGAWAKKNYTAGQVTTFDSATGTWHFRNGTTAQHGAKGDLPVPGDWNGDSRADLMVYRPTTGEWLLHGGATVSHGSPGDVPVPGYYGTDRAMQYAVYRPTTGTWYIRRMPAVKLGSVGDKPVPADYTGDGRTDPGVFNPKTAKWSIRGVGSFTFGKSGDIPVSADYNGDGKAEVAVYRPSTGQWVIRGGATVTWGMPKHGDKPVPGYYNNDVAADLAVFRPNSARYFIRNFAEFQVGRSTHTPLVYR